VGVDVDEAGGLQPFELVEERRRRLVDRIAVGIAARLGPYHTTTKRDFDCDPHHSDLAAKR
jgi:hypothetical protein